MTKVKLLIQTEIGSLQRNFEHYAVEYMNLNPGVFVIYNDGSKYVNKHIQWLWTQYLKGINN